MIGKNPTRKTRIKLGSQGSDRVSETKVNEDTSHVLGEGEPLEGKIGVDDRLEGESV